MRLVEPWLNDFHQTGNSKESLVEIFTKALELCCLLRRQKAIWSLTFPGTAQEYAKDKRSTTFSEETMRDISSCNEFEIRRVDILVAPGLFKTGNTDGQLYEKGESVVKKAEVWCSNT